MLLGGKKTGCRQQQQSLSRTMSRHEDAVASSKTQSRCLKPRAAAGRGTGGLGVVSCENLIWGVLLLLCCQTRSVYEWTV